MNAPSLRAAARPIAVLGEALMDCVAQPDGSLHALLGGSPFNLARAAARQGASVHWLTPMSADSFGQRLREQAQADGVHLLSPLSPKPTSLAVVHLQEGVPHYGFYREGVADRAWQPESMLAHLDGLGAGILHTGSLMLVPPDHEKTLAVMAGARQRGWCVSVDVNLRSRLAADAEAYRAAVWQAAAQADWLKASDEDLLGLGLAQADAERAEDLHRALLERLQALSGRVPSRVALTFGAQGAAVAIGDDWAQSPAPPVRLVDTVGAGDTFWGACLSDWSEPAQRRQPHLDAIPAASGSAAAHSLMHALAAAALNCERQGCQPPHRDEVIARLAASGDPRPVS